MVVAVDDEVVVEFDVPADAATGDDVGATEGTVTGAGTTVVGATGDGMILGQGFEAAGKSGDNGLSLGFSVTAKEVLIDCIFFG